MNHKIEFIRVTGIRSAEPLVLARADGLLVTWRDRKWKCECTQPGCTHIDHVRDLLAPTVYEPGKRYLINNQGESK